MDREPLRFCVHMHVSELVKKDFVNFKESYNNRGTRFAVAAMIKIDLTTSNIMICLKLISKLRLYLTTANFSWVIHSFLKLERIQCD